MLDPQKRYFKAEQEDALILSNFNIDLQLTRVTQFYFANNTCYEMLLNHMLTWHMYFLIPKLHYQSCFSVSMWIVTPETQAKN